MTILGIGVIAMMGLTLLAGLDMLVYRESLYEALGHLIVDYSHGPALFMIAGALLIAGWGDIRAGVMQRLQARRMRDERE